MPDVVTSQVIVSGPRNLIIKLTNVSDGTGENGVLKVDVTAFTPSPGIHQTMWRVDFAVSGMLARLQWQATTAVDMLPLSGYGSFDYRQFGGLTVPNVAGATGSILMTTQGQTSGSSYDITLRLRKNVM